MAIEAIGSVGGLNGAALENAGISQESFLKILLTQLRFQDPLKPMDNQEFVAQLAQFSALELNRQQGDRIESLLGMQSVNQAVALIGKQVEMTGQYAGQVGTVRAVTFSNGEPRMTITTSTTTLIDARLSDITLIRNP